MARDQPGLRRGGRQWLAGLTVIVLDGPPHVLSCLSPDVLERMAGQKEVVTPALFPVLGDKVGNLRQRRMAEEGALMGGRLEIMDAHRRLQRGGAMPRQSQSIRPPGKGAARAS